MGSGPAQRAVLSLIGTGDLERHIRRMRHEYARRREAMTGVLGGGRRGPAGRLLGEEAGMRMVLRTARDAEEIAGAAWRRGWRWPRWHAISPGRVTMNGLVLGYGGGVSSGRSPVPAQLLAYLATEPR